MQINWINDANYVSLKGYEKYLSDKYKFNMDKNFKWTVIDETAVALGKANQSGICFFSVPRGTKINTFSYRKVNQVLFLSYQDACEKSDYETYFYRVIRRFKKTQLRLKLLAVNEQSELEAILDELLKPSLSPVDFQEKIEFVFPLEQKSLRDRFLMVCQEYQTESLQYYISFPMRFLEEDLEKKFIEEDRLLFNGFIKEEVLAPFISALEEEGFDSRGLIIRRIQSVFKK